MYLRTARPSAAHPTAAPAHPRVAAPPASLTSPSPRWSRTPPPLAAWGALAALAWATAAACSGSALLGNAGLGQGDISQATDGAPSGDSDTASDARSDASPSLDGEGPGDASSDGAGDATGSVPAWAPIVLGDPGEISAVSASATGAAVAAAGDRVLRSHGAGWAPYGVPQPGASLRGAWTDGQIAVVVGLGGLLARREGPGAPWTLTNPGDVAGGAGPVDLWAVSGRSADDLWAVGDQAAILHYDGVTWRQVHTGTQLDLRAVFVPADEAAPVVAVGTRGRILEATSSGGWVLKQVATSDVTLHGVWGPPTGGELFAVGTGGTITHRASAQAVWHGQSSNDADGRDLFALAGRTAADLVAVGAQGVILRYDGAAWGVDEAAGPTYAHADLAGVVALPSGGWVAVGAGGGGLLFDGTAWVDAPSRPQVDLHALVGAPDGALWIAGGGGLLLRADGGDGDAGWSVVPTGTDATLRALAVDSAGDAWAVGDHGVLVKTTGAGSAQVYEQPVPVDLEAVLVEGGEVWVTGRGGTLLHGSSDDPAHLVPVPSGTVADLHALARGGDGALWAAGGFGALVRREGGEPAALATGVGGALRALAATPSGVLVAGDNGVLLTATAESVRLDHEAPGVFLYGVAARGGVAFAAGWGGVILRRGTEGQPFQEEPSGTEDVLEALWMSDMRALAVGRRGTLLERLQAPSQAVHQ